MESKSQDLSRLSERIGTYGVVPVAAVEDVERALPLGRALLEGGLPCVELTFRSSIAPKVISKMCQAYPEMLIGAGTVISIEQAELAAEVGAKFFLAPGLDIEIIEWCEKHGILLIPGVMTPTDIGLALKHGIKIQKYFPAVPAGGISALKSVSAPFVDAKFVPTGGINGDNIADFLRLPMVHSCGGSWLVSKDLINNGNFKQITQLTKEAVVIVQKVRAEN